MGDEIAILISNSNLHTTRKSISLFYCIMNIKEIAQHLSQYIRVVDYYSLKRVSKHLKTNILGRSYELKSIIGIRIKDKTLLDIADMSKTVISGSFILKILLSTPHQALRLINNADPSQTDSWSAADIDIYSHPLDTDYCSTCQSITNTKCSSVSQYLCNGRSLTTEPNINPPKYNYWHCYDEIFEDLIGAYHCDIDHYVFNDIIISNERNLVNFIKDEFDFDFLKNYYVDGKLYISHPETVLKQKCTFRIKDFDPKHERYNIYRQDKTLIERIDKYRSRGFNIVCEIAETDRDRICENCRCTDVCTVVKNANII